MKTLTSMTDFVLEIEQNTPKATNFSSFTAIANYEKEMYSKIIFYAKFLKQPLELWMFVPCKLVGGEWVVLEEPDMVYNDGVFGVWNGLFQNKNEYIKEYQEALDKVLFEGIEVIIENKEEEKFFVTIAKEKTWILCSWFYINGTVKENNRNITTIEDLVRYNLPLTKTALKEIGL